MVIKFFHHAEKLSILSPPEKCKTSCRKLKIFPVFRREEFEFSRTYNKITSSLIL